MDKASLEGQEDKVAWQKSQNGLLFKEKRRQKTERFNKPDAGDRQYTTVHPTL